MRILHIVHQYLPEHVGGTELYTQSVSQALARRGHQVTVFCRHGAEGIGQKNRVQGDVRVWSAWNGSLSPARRFFATFGDSSIERAFEQVLDEADPGLVHIQHLMGLPVGLVRSILQKNIPFVITLHDYWWVCANAQLLTNYSQQVCDGPRLYVNCARCALARAGRWGLWPTAPVLSILLAWRNRLLRRVLRQAERLIAPTVFVRRWCSAHGVPVERSVVIPHGLEYPTPDALPRRRKNASVRLAYIGGLSWQKGVHVLLGALHGMQGAELWIAGDESFDPVYVSHLRAQAPSNVRFLGKLSRTEVWETLAQVDVVLVPSLWYETFSLIVHEAFAAGVPVVASRLGALDEIVRDGVDGFLVPPGDVREWRATLQRLVDEQDLLARLQANVRPPLTLERHVDQLESIYEDCVI